MRKERALEVAIRDPSIEWISPFERQSPAANTIPKNKTADSRWELVRQAVGKDGLLMRIIESARKIEAWKSAVIANDIGVDRSQVYEGKRRLQRRLAAITNK